MNITDALEPFAAGEISLKDALDNAANLFYKALEDNTFVCEICGKTIAPKVTANEHGIFVESDRTELRGGLGNKILKSNVCPECARRMTVCK